MNQPEFKLREQAVDFPVRTNKLAELIGENGEIPFSIISAVTVDPFDGKSLHYE